MFNTIETNKPILSKPILFKDAKEQYSFEHVFYVPSFDVLALRFLELKSKAIDGAIIQSFNPTNTTINSPGAFYHSLTDLDTAASILATSIEIALSRNIDKLKRKIRIYKPTLLKRLFVKESDEFKTLKDELKTQELIKKEMDDRYQFLGHDGFTDFIKEFNIDKKINDDELAFYLPDIDLKSVCLYSVALNPDFTIKGDEPLLKSRKYKFKKMKVYKGTMTDPNYFIGATFKSKNKEAFVKLTLNKTQKTWCLSVDSENTEESFFIDKDKANDFQNKLKNKTQDTGKVFSI